MRGRHFYAIELIRAPAIWLALGAALVTFLALMSQPVEQWSATRMLATVHVEVAVLVLAPMAVFIGSTSSRAAALKSGRDALLSPTWRERAPRVAVTFAAACTWAVTPLIVAWLATLMVSSRGGAIPYFSSLWIGVAGIAAATAIGVLLGSLEYAMVSTIVVSAGAYVLLAGWNYVPSNPGRILVPRSGAAFFPSASVAPSYATVTVLWLLLLTAMVVFWTVQPRLYWRLTGLAALVIIGAWVVVLGSSVPELVHA